MARDAADRDRGHSLVQAVLQEQLERPLAEVDPLPERRWNTWDIAVFAVVDTVGNGPLTVGYGDSDGPGFHAPLGGFGR